MAIENRFKQSIVAILAKRAANRCSNPDCGAITCGPTEEANGTVNVGEAAHIYGANPGSARFDPTMTAVERSDISNAIWLCGNCHKLIDDDPSRYPAGLLFEWQREHEREIAKQIGKVGVEIRDRYNKRHLEEFGRLSYLAERLIVEKEDYWEYRLTAEVLRFELEPILRRWEALKRHLYVKPVTRIPRTEFISLIRDKNSEVLSIAKAFGELMNHEFARAWGEPGMPGSDIEIVSTCRLVAELCQRCLHWEEEVRFIVTDDIFDEILSLYVGVAGRLIDETRKMPDFFSNMFSEDEKPLGTYKLDLQITLPDGWAESVDAAFKKITKLY